MKEKGRKKAMMGKPEFDPSLEEIAKFGAMSGRLVEFVLIITAVLMLSFFIITGLWQDVSKIHSLEIGMMINIGLIGFVVIVLLYVTANVNISKGDALCRLDNPEGYKEAIKKYEKALKIDRRSKKAWMCKGLALRMISHDEDILKEALRNHNRALKIDPKDTVAWVNKGNVLFNLGRTDEAITCHNKALDLDPNYTTGWVNKGELLVKLGKREEAKKCLDTAQSLTEGKGKTSAKVPEPPGGPVTFLAGLIVLFIGLFISLGSMVHNTVKVFVNETSWSVYGPWDWSAVIIGAVALLVGIILLMFSNMTKVTSSVA
ncbi:MAG: tetratricopeptide repeat protein [Thermoplasmata archaeon]